ncbi:MAG: ATP-dependent 6-phosphofructokinase [Candidatus Omnitrophota bacterium]
MKKSKRGRIGILTAGGDCPGLNAVIRAVAKKLINDQHMEIIGIKDGYEGLINNRYRKLTYQDVSGIFTLGGTILGTSNIANPYREAVHKKGKLVFEDVSDRTIKNIKKMRLDGLVCIGGDGTLSIADKLRADGVSIVGVPKTIDNDIRGTECSFGFDSAVHIAAEGIDRVHTTAQSHHRIMVIELMGRTAGWIALYAGIAGGGDIILIPEIPYDIQKIVKVVKERNKRGSRFSIIVISEGARPKGGEVVVREIVKESTIQARLGGIGILLAKQLEKITNLETRVVVMGHLLRGGSPTPSDRILATRLGIKTAELIEQGQFGYMVALKNGNLNKVSLKKVAQGPRLVPKNHALVKAARAVGTCFGD